MCMGAENGKPDSFILWDNVPGYGDKNTIQHIGKESKHRETGKTSVSFLVKKANV